jgi:UDP-glucose 4-epimerase
MVRLHGEMRRLEVDGIDLSQASAVRRVIYGASSSAYGDQDTLPLHEGMKPNPKSPYGLQKYVGEHYMRLAAMFWGLETVSLRYFNVYGPRLTFKGAYVTVIAVFLKQRDEGLPLTITSDGTQTRDFTYVDDVVAANLAAMDSRKTGHGEVINIGAGNNHSVNEVAGIIGGPTTYIPPRVEPHDTLADNRLARDLLGWSPKISFEEGLKRTIEWFQNLRTYEKTQNFARGRSAAKFRQDRSPRRRVQKI